MEADSLSKIVRVKRDAIEVSQGGTFAERVLCPVGYKAVGGGYVTSDFSKPLTLEASWPSTVTVDETSVEAWNIRGKNNSNDNTQVSIYVNCIKASSLVLKTASSGDDITTDS